MIVAVGLGLIFAAALFVCLPLVRGAASSGVTDGGEEPAARWERQKLDAYAAIKDLELDFQMGKLSAEDYAELRGALEARAVEALKEIERQRPAGRAGARPAAVRFCPACGAAVGAGAFCAGCGAPVRQAAS